MRLTGGLDRGRRLIAPRGTIQVQGVNGGAGKIVVSVLLEYEGE